MERESFEDDEVAAMLNEHYVAIKVDREERPDIDMIYMNFCQNMTGQGGWPLTVIVAPDKTPFFAGTYFPKESRWGRPGLMDLLEHIRREWARDQEGLMAHGREIAQLLQLKSRPASRGLSLATGEKAAAQMQSSFDPHHGGFGGAPKFPGPHNLLFLLRFWYRTGHEAARQMVADTLSAMHHGGIYDHLGFGFSRYSTDNKWLVPHFEKMLYDNALLCYAYLETFLCTGNREFSTVAEEIIAYVLRDMTSPEGGFYSAEDADSEGEEGRFYVWRPDEILALLGEESGKIFNEYYHVTTSGNFECGTSILNTIRNDLPEFAAKYGLPVGDMLDLLAAGRQKLYQAREKRVHPFKDDKILTGWNGLMIASLFKAGRVLENPEYIAAAKRALDFVLRNMVRADGRLLARYRVGEAEFPAYLDDYAFLLWALLEGYESTFEYDYVTKACQWAETMERLFWDPANGGFFFYGSDGEQLLTRPKEIYDSAVPSGNSAAAYVLLKLSRITDWSRFQQLAEGVLQCFAAEVERHPAGYSFLLCATELNLAPPRQIVVVGSRQAPETQAMLGAVEREFLPNTTVIFRDPREAGGPERMQDMTEVDGRPAVYLCENFVCRKPITELEELVRALNPNCGCQPK